MASRSATRASRTSVIHPAPRYVHHYRISVDPEPASWQRSRTGIAGGGTMSVHVNQLGQPIGFPMPNWQPRPRPPRHAIDGRFCRLEAFDPDGHCADLFDAYAEDKAGRIWTYLPYGPFASLAGFCALMRAD